MDVSSCGKKQTTKIQLKCWIIDIFRQFWNCSQFSLFFSHSPTETFSHSFCSHNFFHFSDFGAYKRHLFHSLGHSLMMTMMMAYKNKMFERDHVCVRVCIGRSIRPFVYPSTASFLCTKLRIKYTVSMVSFAKFPLCLVLYRKFAWMTIRA